MKFFLSKNSAIKSALNNEEIGGQKNKVYLTHKVPRREEEKKKQSHKKKKRIIKRRRERIK